MVIILVEVSFQALSLDKLILERVKMHKDQGLSPGPLMS